MPDLPPEIVLLIFSYCQTQNLLILTTINRQYGPDAERFLYRHINLKRSTTIGQSGCLHTLAHSPSKCALVKSFTYHSGDKWNSTGGFLIGALENLQISLRCMSNLTHLNLFFRPPSDLVALFTTIRQCDFSLKTFAINLQGHPQLRDDIAQWSKSHSSLKSALFYIVGEDDLEPTFEESTFLRSNGSSPAFSLFYGEKLQNNGKHIVSAFLDQDVTLLAPFFGREGIPFGQFILRTSPKIKYHDFRLYVPSGYTVTAERVLDYMTSLSTLLPEITLLEIVLSTMEEQAVFSSCLVEWLGCFKLVQLIRFRTPSGMLLLPADPGTRESQQTLAVLVFSKFPKLDAVRFINQDNFFRTN